MRLRIKLENSSLHSCYQVNVADPREISANLKKILVTEAITVVIANAGVVTGKPARALSNEEIDLTFDVNTKQHMCV